VGQKSGGFPLLPQPSLSTTLHVTHIVIMFVLGAATLILVAKVELLDPFLAGVKLQVGFPRQSRRACRTSRGADQCILRVRPLVCPTSYPGCRFSSALLILLAPAQLRNKPARAGPHLAAICYDSAMRKIAILGLGVALCGFSLVSPARAQTGAGALEIIARITPTGARPEPVRQFTFYILTKSYSEIVKEVEEKDPIPPRDQFIDGLKVSPELRSWLKGHDTLDLAEPAFDKLLTPDDILNIPEFLLAYQRSNSGGVTSGLPRPKYTEADKTEHPEKYEKQKQDYLASLRKFIHSRPETVSGVELELEGVNPQRKWAALQNDRRKRVLRVAPEVAQLKFLAAKADTDLEGRASLSGVVPGDYWISSLNLDADAGDMRVRWDVPVKIERGKTIRIELSNLNSIDARSSTP